MGGGVDQGHVHQGSEWTQLIRRSSQASVYVCVEHVCVKRVCGRICFNSQFDLIVIWSALSDTEKMTEFTHATPPPKKRW